MEDKEKSSGEERTEGAARKAKAKTTRSRRSVEDRLDELADRFSKAMNDGVRRLEDAFDKHSSNLKDNPDLPKEKIKGFFSSSMGGAVLVIIGALWFFYAVGLFDNWFIPFVVIIVGIYLLMRSKSAE